MVGHERPGKTIGFGSDEKLRHAFKKKRFVIVIEKDVSLFDAANYHMLEKTWNIDTSCSWHSGKINTGKSSSQPT